jgi:hypothetical protein
VTSDPLDPILATAATAAGQLRRPQVEAIGRAVSSLPPEEFIEAAVLAPGLSWDDGQPRPPDYFEIHSRRWWIDLSHSDTRQHLAIAVTAAALVDALHLHLSTTWVTKVLPSVVAIRCITRDGDGLLFELRRRPAPPLPRHLADTVHPGDYAEFVQAIEEAAASLRLPVGGTIKFTTHDGTGTDRA